MRAPHRMVLLLILASSCAVAQDWETVVSGVAYRRVLHEGIDAHVVRVDLHEDSLEVVASAADERGLTVSEFARGRDAIAAVNGDYYDASLWPIGLAMGDGVVWAQANEQIRREEVVGVGRGRVRIFPRADPLRVPKRWMKGAVAGWPMIVERCSPVAVLPGSDYFTSAPHPRTAIGLSKHRRYLLLVVVEGRREGAPGLSLPDLARLMVESGACTALNLDGGGSSTLWLRDGVVNQPSDGVERKVSNHLGVKVATAQGGNRATPPVDAP